MRQPPEIRQLSDSVANTIAAGEVIERPANVVKELAENAIDAGATRIDVRIEDGGRRLVEVIDDGHGMWPEDLTKALGRHATSKIASADDLFRVQTLGFRGEALPSIAVVSEFELASRPHDAASGCILKAVGGEIRSTEACAMAPGTRVSVRNLFWNVPVRLKFLKTQAAEAGQVADMLTRLALGHPGVAFRLENAGKTEFDLPGDDVLQGRVRTLFGRELAEGLIAVAGHAEGAQLSGFIAHPRFARPSSKRQFVFLNGRSLRDRLLIAAVREGFRGFTDPRLVPVVFLHLEVDPALVDVNVHPTKSEVRFRREQEVFHVVRQTLHDALSREAGASPLLSPTDRAAPVTYVAPPAAQSYQRTVVKPALPTPLPAPAPRAPFIQERFLPQNATPVASPPQEAPSVAPACQVQDREPAYAAVPPTPPVSDPIAGVRQIIQLNDMYLLVETVEGIRLIDQHALHEKAIFLCLDPATRDLVAGGRQELLVPKTIELSAGEVAAIEGHLPRLAESGIEVERFGPATLLLRAYPGILERVNWPAFFAALASEGPGRDALAKLGEDIIHRRACRAAVKAGQRLSPEECRELVRLLYRIEGLDHCPHGRPTVLDLPWSELERRFQR